MYRPISLFLYAFLFIIMTIGVCFADPCSDGLIRSMREEGLSARQIDSICKRAKNYDVPKPDKATIMTLLSEKLDKLESAEVTQWGKYSKMPIVDTWYWPAKVRVIYWADEWKKLPNGMWERPDGKPEKYDKIFDCQLYQDEYGKWKISKK